MAQLQADKDLLLASFDSVPILARNNLDPRRSDHLIRLHLERRILHDKGPHVIAQSISVQVPLELRLGLDLLDHRVCERLVKLLQNLHRQLGRNSTARDELIERIRKSHPNG